MGEMTENIKCTATEILQKIKKIQTKISALEKSTQDRLQQLRTEIEELEKML